MRPTTNGDFVLFRFLFRFFVLFFLSFSTPGPGAPRTRVPFYANTARGKTCGGGGGGVQNESGFIHAHTPTQTLIYTLTNTHIFLYVRIKRAEHCTHARTRTCTYDI